MATVSGGVYNAVVTYDSWNGDILHPTYYYHMDIYVYKDSAPLGIQLTTADFQHAVSFSGAYFQTGPNCFANTWSVSLSDNVLSLSSNLGYSSDVTYTSDRKVLEGRNETGRESTFRIDEIRIHTANRYTILLLASGNGTVSGGGKYAEGSDVTISATPDDYYEFVRWSDGNTSNPRTVTVSGNATYIAEFLPSVHTVRFSVKHGGQTELEHYELTGSVESPITVPRPSYWENHTFAYWQNGSTQLTPEQSYIPTADLTFIDVFTLNTYTVTFNPNGGTVSPTSVSGTSGTSFTYPTPTRPYHTFVGWYSALSGGTKIADGGDTGTITGNLTVFARWSEIVYTVSYVSQSGNIPSVQVTNSQGTVLPSPTVTDKRMDGWYDGNGSTGQYIGKGGDTYHPTANITLYARFSANYILTFYRNFTQTDNTVIARLSIGQGDTATLPSQQTNRYFHSVGWNTARNRSGTSLGRAGTVITPTQSMSIYAQWDANPTVTFHQQNGSADIVVRTVNDSAPYVFYANDYPSNPVKQYYHFDKWNTSSSGSGSNITINSQFSANAEVYAIYSVVKATAITIAMNGEVGDAVTLRDLGIVRNLTATLSSQYPGEEPDPSVLTWTSDDTAHLTVYADTDKRLATTVPIAYADDVIEIQCKATYSDGTTVTGSFYVYIKANYQVIFINGSDVYTSDVDEDTHLIEDFPDTPERQGFVFNAWLTPDNTKITSDSLILRNTTVTAYWIKTYDEFDKDNAIVQLYNYEGNAITKQFSLGTITSFTLSYSVRPAIIPTPTQDSSKTMITDASGTTGTLSLDCVRASPVDVDDTSEDYHLWSNTKWLNELISLVDRWQSDTDGIKILFLPNDCQTKTIDSSEISFGRFFNLLGTSKSTYTTGFRYNNRWYQGQNALITSFTPSISATNPEQLKISIRFTFGGMKANYV